MIENFPIKLLYLFAGGALGIVITAGYYQRHIALAMKQINIISTSLSRLRRTGVWR